ncbi:DUF3299 domain-containing protein [Arenicella sp. 4NH20-0111]|uniref:DUF3299 domain-containing protein n=1 Tax=Arenicella sp. 4NH20-0111 TaxID=3127648 RepID=UPI0033406ECD
MKSKWLGIKFFWMAAGFLLVSACSQQAEVGALEYRELGWEDLKPVEANPASSGADSNIGSLEIIDNRYTDDYYSDASGLGGGYYGAPPQAYSSEVIAEMDGQSVRLPGFIVPVEFDSGNSVTEFFLVPYFGACYHKPPPPPNQTVYVISTEPIKFDSIYDPVWVQGVIETKQNGNSIAMAAYSLNFHKLESFYGS